jgi:hypothetical protein
VASVVVASAAAVIFRNLYVDAASFR